MIDSEFSGGDAEINVFIADGVTGYYDAYLPGPGEGGDIVLNSQFLSGIDSLSPELYHQVVRAFGHSLGLNDDLSVSNLITTMSSRSTNNVTPTSQDLHLLRSVYGDNYFNANRRFSSLEAPRITAETRGQYATYAGADFDYPTFDARQTGADATDVKLAEGGISGFFRNDESNSLLMSIVNGVGVNYRDYLGAEVRDVVMGNSMSNTIRTFGGNDFINAGPGDDLLIGSSGNDWYALTQTGGDDIIREYDGSPDFPGRDAIRYIDHWLIDHGRTELEELFVFKRDGNDLVVNLTLDAPGPQASMTIENMAFGRHRVERLEMTDLSGNVLWAASLVDVFGQLSDGQQRRFAMTDAADKFGALVAPAFV